MIHLVFKYNIRETVQDQDGDLITVNHLIYYVHVPLYCDYSRCLFGLKKKKRNPVTKESGYIVLYSMYFFKKKLYLYWMLLYLKSSTSLRKESSGYRIERNFDSFA